MGVDLLALRQGTLQPLDALKQISEALERQPNEWMRNKEAIELFNRAGIQSLPMLVELNRSLSASLGLSVVNQDGIDKMVEANREIVLMETKLKLLKIRLEELAAKPFLITVELVGKWLGGGPSGSKIPLPPGAPDIGFGPAGPDTMWGRIGGALKQQAADAKAPYEAARVYAQGALKNNLEAAEQELSIKKQTFDQNLKLAAQGLVTLNDLKQSEQEYRKIKSHVEAIRKAESDRQTIEEALRRARLESAQRLENPFMLPAEATLNRNLRMHGITPAQRFSFQWNAAPQIAFERQEQTDKFGRQMLETQETVQREIQRARMGGVDAVEYPPAWRGRRDPRRRRARHRGAVSTAPGNR